MMAKQHAYIRRCDWLAGVNSRTGGNAPYGALSRKGAESVQQAVVVGQRLRVTRLTVLKKARGGSLRH